MIEKCGDLFEIRRNYDAICCTTNAVVKSNGELVMGAGVAKAFSEHYPWLAHNWGQRVKKYPDIDVFVTLMRSKPHLIYFRTKNHYKDKSRVDDVESAIFNLVDLTNRIGWKKVLLPRPGCGYGELDWKKDVKHILEKNLDDRFEVITHGINIWKIWK